MDYAIYDTIDKCWLGDEKGVVTWPDFDLASIACTIVTEQMGLDYSLSVHKRARYRVAQYDGTATKYKDEVQTKMTPLQAIQKIEGFKE